MKLCKLHFPFCPKTWRIESIYRTSGTRVTLPIQKFIKWTALMGKIISSEKIKKTKTKNQIQCAKWQLFFSSSKTYFLSIKYFVKQEKLKQHFTLFCIALDLYISSKSPWLITSGPLQHVLWWELLLVFGNFGHDLINGGIWSILVIELSTPGMYNNHFSQHSQPPVQYRSLILCPNSPLSSRFQIQISYFWQTRFVSKSAY